MTADLAVPASVRRAGQARATRGALALALESDGIGRSLGVISAALVGLVGAAAALRVPPEQTLTSVLGTLGTAAALAILFAAPVRTTLGRSAVTIGAIVIVTLFCWVLRPAAPTVVWLYALVIPALGLTLGPVYGALAGAFSAPALHWIETGVAVDIIDPQTPFGILILVALGSAPGYFLKIARERRGKGGCAGVAWIPN